VDGADYFNSSPGKDFAGQALAKRHLRICLIDLGWMSVAPVGFNNQGCCLGLGVIFAWTMGLALASLKKIWHTDDDFFIYVHTAPDIRS
jgi:hypothetical protein